MLRLIVCAVLATLTIASVPNCQKNGQILPNNDDLCSYYVCDYGSEPAYNKQGVAKFVAVRQACAPGTGTGYKFNPHNPCSERNDQCSKGHYARSPKNYIPAPKKAYVPRPEPKKSYVPEPAPKKAYAPPKVIKRPFQEHYQPPKEYEPKQYKPVEYKEPAPLEPRYDWAPEYKMPAAKKNANYNVMKFDYQEPDYKYKPIENYQAGKYNPYD